MGKGPVSDLTAAAWCRVDRGRCRWRMGVVTLGQRPRTVDGLKQGHGRAIERFRCNPGRPWDWWWTGRGGILEARGVKDEQQFGVRQSSWCLKLVVPGRSEPWWGELCPGHRKGDGQ